MTATVDSSPAADGPAETEPAGDGRVVRINGPVVDIEFSAETMPPIYNALHVDITIEDQTSLLGKFDTDYTLYLLLPPNPLRGDPDWYSNMNNLGRRAYGLGAIALGLVGLAFGDFALVWQPVPPGVPDRVFLAYAVAAALALVFLWNIPRTDVSLNQAR